MERDACFQNPPRLSKRPGKQTPSRFPTRGGILWREMPVSRAFCYISLEFLKKNLLIKRNFFTLLSKAVVKELPPMFPKTGPLRKQTPISTAVLSISFGVPSKGVLPPGSLHRAATE
jgi:hypothetical protein